MRWMFVVLVMLVLPILTVVIVGAFLPRTHTATRSLQVQQTPELVYSLISGPPTWRSTVRSYEPVGMIDGKPSWREVDHHNHAITFEEEEVDPPTRRVIRIADKNLPFGGTWTFEIRPASRGCVLQITENGEIYNPVFRFISRFFRGYDATINQYLKDVEDHYNGLVLRRA